MLSSVYVWLMSLVGNTRFLAVPVLVLPPLPPPPPLRLPPPLPPLPVPRLRRLRAIVRYSAEPGLSVRW